MDKEELKAMLVARIYICCTSCNSYHINHVEGQIRALLSAVTDGASPMSLQHNRPALVLKEAGIPFTETKEGAEIDEQWLKDHGFTNTSGKQTPNHPKYSHW